MTQHLPEKIKKHIPTNFQHKTAWSALTALSIVALFLVAVGSIFVTNKILVFLEPVLLPVMIAAVLAYLLEPIVAWLERRKFSRIWAVISVMSALFASITIFFLAIVPPLVDQTSDLIQDRDRIWNQTMALVDNIIEKPLVANSINKLYYTKINQIQPELLTEEDNKKISGATTTKDKLIIYLDLNSSTLLSKATTWLTSGSKAMFGMIGIIVGLVMTPIFMFYFLKESVGIQKHWHDFLPLKTSQFKKEVVDTLQEINGYLISFFRGQMLVSLIDGAIIAVLLKIMGLPYAITIGVAAAILGIIPYLGTIVTLIPALLIAWASTPAWWDTILGMPDWSYILAVFTIFIGVSQFDSWVIQPKIVGNSVGLHPLTVMFSVLFWTLILGGLIGALLAVPLTASIKVLFRRYIWETIKKPETPVKLAKNISDRKNI